MGQTKKNRHGGRAPDRPKAPRLLWGPGRPRLFGPDGREYEIHATNLPAKEVKRLARRGQVPFAVQECGEGVDWFDSSETSKVWDRLRPDFEDVDDWHAPPDAPGAQPYRAELWQTITGRDQVLLLTDG